MVPGQKGPTMRAAPEPELEPELWSGSWGAERADERGGNPLALKLARPYSSITPGCFCPQRSLVRVSHEDYTVGLIV